MKQLLDNSRICPVCKVEISDARKASYLEYKGLPVVFHDTCLSSLDETLVERTEPTPRPVQKAGLTPSSPVRVFKGASGMAYSEEERRAVIEAFLMIAKEIKNDE